jgi:hypothetical protein
MDLGSSLAIVIALLLTITMNRMIPDRHLMGVVRLSISALVFTQTKIQMISRKLDKGEAVEEVKLTKIKGVTVEVSRSEVVVE